MARFRQMSDSIGVDFIVISGDLIRDALRQTEATASAYYKLYVQEISKFKMPVYSALGNHELFGIERDKSLVSTEHPLYGKKMYRHFLGPNYYSFNYGGIHFISIDDVDYQNLYYYGGVDSLQLKWLEKDLKPVSKVAPIITFNHIPFMSPGFSFFDYENDIFYGPNLLTHNGKLHHRHIAYNFKEVSKRIGDRPYPLALSGHYHAAQEGVFIGTDTKFAQTSAITRPDSYVYNDMFKVRSGFTLFEVQDGKIVSSTFVPLNLK
jgi:predicted MPP superfamily phosphohydrolase